MLVAGGALLLGEVVVEVVVEVVPVVVVVGACVVDVVGGRIMDSVLTSG